MATFKVGQRVRIAKHIAREPVPLFDGQPFIGREATILRLSWVLGEDWDIAVDGDRRVFCALSEELSPLTDPKAEAFLESIRQLRPLDVRETA